METRTPELTAHAAEAFEALVRRVRDEQEHPRARGAPEPLRPGDVEPLPRPGDARYADVLALGEEALRRGEVAAVVVAGGAGTRFGADVKGLVEVLDGKTFLDLKLEQARDLGERYGRSLPVRVMTSDQTHAAIAAHLARTGEGAILFRQRMLPRLEPGSWTIFRDEAGRPSFAPSGHGDFFRALRETGVGQELQRLGVRYLFFSNVDNLAATVAPVVVGAHIASGASVTVEVTRRAGPGGKLDAGAAPVRVGRHVELVEKVDPRQHALISTNNLLFTLEPLLDRRIELPYRVVEKRVGDRTALQLEQVTGEVTGVLDERGEPVLAATYLEVPRDDPATTRFEPVKAREDLAPVVDRLRARQRH